MMPRRKQDAPRRLKHKSTAYVAQSSADNRAGASPTQDGSRSANWTGVEEMRHETMDDISAESSTRLEAVNARVDDDADHACSFSHNDEQRDASNGNFDESYLASTKSCKSCYNETPCSANESSFHTQSLAAACRKTAATDAIPKKSSEIFYSNADSKCGKEECAPSVPPCSPKQRKSHRDSPESQCINERNTDDADSDAKSGYIEKATQLHLIEAMMRRQRHVNEECEENSWVRMQPRTDHNCLSKSKAERYRWCVQEHIKGVDCKKIHATTNRDRAVTMANSSDDTRTSSVKPQTSPMQERLYSTVFAGGSKFCCRDCGNPFSTLVDLTVHMSKTGHYRDQNIRSGVKDKEFDTAKKRSVMDVDEKQKQSESVGNVLKCLGCGHSFDSLQDLSVHMIKTRHYEDVPSLRFCQQKNDASAGAKFLCLSQCDTKRLPPADTNDSRVNVAHRGQDKRVMLESRTGSTWMHHGMQGVPTSPNLQALNAASLLGFPSYTVPLPFSGLLGNIALTNPAAIAAAGVFISAPWLAHMRDINTMNMLERFPRLAATIPNPGAPQLLSLTSDAREELITSMSRSFAKGHSACKSPCMHEGVDFRCNEDQLVPDKVDSCCPSSNAYSEALQESFNDVSETARITHAVVQSAKEKVSSRGGWSQMSSPGTVAPDHHSSRRSPIPEESVNTKAMSVSGSVGSSSPLEQLAVLANGSSFGQRRMPPGMKNSVKERESSESGRNHERVSACFSETTKKRIVLPPSPQKCIPVDCSISAEDNRIQDSTTPHTDFIKSLECAVQSAISKVNQPSKNHCDAPPLPPRSDPEGSREQGDFTGRSVHRPSHSITACAVTDVGHRPKTFCGSGGQSSAASSSTAIVSISNNTENNRCFGNTCDVSSPGQARSEGLSTDDQQRKRHISKRDINAVGTIAGSWRLQKKTRANLGTETLQTNDPHTLCTTDSRTLSSYRISHNDRTKTDPLKEIQKIINSTSITRKPEIKVKLGVTKNENPGQRKRSPAGGPLTVSHSKRCKTVSVLNDLVHAGCSPPRVNPLSQMEHLVNLKIGGDSTDGRKSSSLFARDVACLSHVSEPRPSENLQVVVNEKHGGDPMSALLRLTDKTVRRFHVNSECDSRDVASRQSRPLPRKDKTNTKSERREAKLTKRGVTCANETSPSYKEAHKRGHKQPRQNPNATKTHSQAMAISDHSRFSPNGCEKYCLAPQEQEALNPQQEMQLQFHCVANLDRLRHGNGFSDAECGNLSETIGIRPSFIKKWIKSTKKRLSEKRGSNFISQPGGSDQFCFRCKFCDSFPQVPSASSFLQHLSTHIDVRPHLRVEDDGSEESNDNERDGQKRSTKTHSVMKASLPELPAEATNYLPSFGNAFQDDSVVRPLPETSERNCDKHRCAEGLKAADEALIQVSG